MKNYYYYYLIISKGQNLRFIKMIKKTTIKQLKVLWLKLNKLLEVRDENDILIFNFFGWSVERVKEYNCRVFFGGKWACKKKKNKAK